MAWKSVVLFSCAEFVMIRFEGGVVDIVTGGRLGYRSVRLKASIFCVTVKYHKRMIGRLIHQQDGQLLPQYIQRAELWSSICVNRVTSMETASIVNIDGAPYLLCHFQWQFTTRDDTYVYGALK
jgi:hypothetical protein